MAWRLRLRRDRPDLNFRPRRPQNPPPQEVQSVKAATEESTESTTENEDSEAEESDSSTVATSAKRRLRRRHKLRFRQSREEVYAQQYVYKVLAESRLYSECEGDQNRQFYPLEVTLLVLKAMRKLDIDYKVAMLRNLRNSPENTTEAHRMPNVLYN